MVDEFIIFISPPFETGSVFITTNTFIHLPFLYNKNYSVEVVASHCAGNSTPAEISFRIGMSMSLNVLGLYIALAKPIIKSI